MNLITSDALAGEVVVVTGGSRGLGREMSLAFASAGARVFAAGRDEAHLSETVELAAGASGSVEPLTFDVADEAAVAAAASRVVDEAGRVDVLTNCAGVALYKSALETTDDEWGHVLETNLTGLFRCCREFGRHMVAAGRGRIINVASDIGIRGLDGWTAYAASKGGVISLSKSLAWEWAPDVRVNVLAPGAFETDMNADLRQIDGLYELAADAAPLGRWGQPEEIGPLAVLLASAATDYMTGTVVSLDGGVQRS